MFKFNIHTYIHIYIYRYPNIQKSETPSSINRKQSKQNTLILPILAPFALYHEIIRVIWHLTLAIPSKQKPKSPSTLSITQKNILSKDEIYF